MTHDLQVMIIAYRLHTCFINSRHVATYNRMSSNLLQYKVTCFTDLMPTVITFRVSHRRREMHVDHAAFPHYCTDPEWGMVGGVL